MRCTNCGCENPGYAVVCERCGEFLPKEDLTGMRKKGAADAGSGSILDPVGTKRIRCSYCWHPNPAEAEFCEVCGMPLAYVPFSENEGEFSEIPQPEEGGEPGDIQSEEGREAGIAQFGDGGFPDISLPEGDGFPDVVLPREAVQAASATGENPTDGKETIRCTKCWEYSPADSTNCQWCGATLSKHGVWTKARGRYGRQYCTCGYKNLPRVTVCLRCGGEVKPEEVVLADGRKVCTCGYKNLPGVSICLKCKNYVLKKCRHCGFEQPANVTVCAKCKLHVD